MKKVFLILVFFLTTNLFSQDLIEYHQLFYEAKYEYENENYNLAYQLFDSLYATYDREVSITDGGYSMFLISAEKSGNCYQAFEGIKFLVEKAGEPKEYLSADSNEISLVYKRSGFDDFLYDHYRKIYLSNINFDLRKRITTLNELDQKYRRGPRTEEITKKRIAQDKINAKNLIDFFNTHGYPSSQLIGNTTIDNKHIFLTAVIRHASDSLKTNFFLPKMLESIQNDGFCPPDFYRSILEQHRQRKGLPPMFTYNSSADDYEIDQNRIQAGLPPLKMD